MQNQIWILLDLKLAKRQEQKSVDSFLRCHELSIEIALLEHLLLSNGVDMKKIEAVEKQYRGE